MSLNIKNSEAERLARELAATTGESVTRAVSVAVRERLDKVRHGHQAGWEERAARMREIAHDAAGRWPGHYRTGDPSDVLYDDDGLPR